MLFNCGFCLYCVVIGDFFFLENHTLCSLIIGRYNMLYITEWLSLHLKRNHLKKYQALVTRKKHIWVFPVVGEE